MIIAESVARSSGGDARNQAQVKFRRSGLSLVLTAALVASAAVTPVVAANAAAEGSLPTTLQSNPPWALDQIDQRATAGDSAYRYDTTGAGVTVYVIGTGIRFSHSEFGGRAVSGRDFVDGDNNATDCNGIGTAIAGAIGGSTYGVAKAVTLVSVRVGDCAGAIPTDTIIAALNWVAVQPRSGPALAVLPLGGAKSSSSEIAVANVVSKGISVVAAASESLRGGNDACQSSPGAAPSAITVAATDSSDKRANSSDTGTCVDLFAPGVKIQSAWDESDTATGTSGGNGIAAAIVTGVVARYLQANPTATPAKVSAALVAAATPNVVVSPGTGSPNRLVYVAPPANTAPGAPSAVSVATNGTTATATISWQPPVSNGGSPITSYRVSRDGADAAGNGPWSTVVPATARSLAFPGLTSGSSYQLSVQAITAVDTGVAASGTVTMPAIPPGIPTAFAVAKNDAAKSATITWGPPTSTAGLPIIGYRVSRDGTDSTGAGPWSATVPPAARSQTFPALKPGGTYTLSVQAITTEGTGTAATGPITMNAVVPGVPTAVSVRKYSTGVVLMRWSPPTTDGGSPITGYRLTRNGTDSRGGGPLTLVVPADRVSQLSSYIAAGRSYTFTIQAINAVGAGPVASTGIRL